MAFDLKAFRAKASSDERNGMSMGDQPCYCGDDMKLAADEIERLRGMIDQTKDNALLPDCDHLFCPQCSGEVTIDYDIAYCWDCPNGDSGEAEPTPPLPLSLTGCFSTQAAAEAAGDE